jgi:hypothetical protein
MILIRYFVFFLFFPFLLFSQKRNNFKTISFIQKDSIINLKEYKKGSAKNLNDLVLNLDKTNDNSNYKKMRDSIINSISDKSFEEKKILHYKRINDSIISRTENTKDSNDKNSIIINTKTEKEYYNFPYDKKYDIAFSFPFEKIKNLKIKEFRKQKKILDNILCFKIKCTYQIIINHEEFRNVFKTGYDDQIINIESEMWITEEIKSIYHPAFKVREILEKYYPIYIEEKNSQMPGRIRKMKLNKIT